MYFVLKDIKRRWRGRRVCLYPPPPRPNPTKYVCVIKRDNSKTEIGLKVPAFYFVFGVLLIPKMYVYMYMCLCAIFSCASMENGQKQSCVRYQLIYYCRKYDAIACNISKIYCYAIYKVTKFLILAITVFF